jgi:hypothetical protein
MKILRTLLFVTPLFVAGLWLMFGVPSYLERAPKWYFQLPSVLPPQAWAPAARILGFLLIIVPLVIAVIYNSTGPTKKPAVLDNTRLLVILVSSDGQLLVDAADGLEKLRTLLMVKFDLKELSVIRCNFNFCIETLRAKKRNYPVLVIAEHALYSDSDKADAIKKAGVTALFTYRGCGPEYLADRFNECVDFFLRNPTFWNK